MKLIIVLSLVVSFAFADSDNNKSGWNGWNNPMKMDSEFIVNFDALPTSGNLEEAGLAWPGYYWANNRGGIAQRWRSNNPQDFKYQSPSADSLISLDKEFINNLSPAEKYDLYLGNYDYPTVRRVWGETSKNASSWHGICHGVSPSSLNHAEPKQVVLYNPDGIEVTFYSSDVKALLAYYYAKISDSKVVQVGKRCFVNSRIPLFRNSDGCSDVNPGSLHIIMANKLGISKTGFIADMDRYSQVWNHPAIKFESKVLKRRGNRVLISSRVTYSASVRPSDMAVIGTNNAKYDTRTYKYWLDLDSSGNITGGEWESKDRPDFLWYKEKSEFTGYWEGLSEVYRAN